MTPPNSLPPTTSSALPVDSSWPEQPTAPRTAPGPAPSRRLVLATGAATLGATALATGHATAADAYPFTLGVASGDPTPDGVVLWTRLATDPVAPDGLGGLGQTTSTVEWELATDESFRRIVRRGTVTTDASVGHSVHVELSGLRPSARYAYRFRTGGHVSPVGRTRTAPAATALESARIGVVSCAQWEHGWFTAYRHLAAEQPDLVLHLGDYIYEHGPLGYPVSSGRARKMVGGEIYTLADYRRRHALYKTDADLQALHAAAPWLVVFDDHEVDNDWAGLYHEVFGKTASFARRRAAGFQAYWENMPLRRSSVPTAEGIRLHRRITWGRTANLHLLDTRQYRSDQTGWVGPVPATYDVRRTMLGAEQEAWLDAGLRASEAQWDILGQQVMVAQYDMMAGPGFMTNQDAWDGYVAAKDRLLTSLEGSRVANPVVLTGDVHESFANDLWRTTDSGRTTIASELVTTSVTSGGDGKDSQFTRDAENPHIRYHETTRGYLRIDLSPTQLTAAFRAVDTVSSRGGAVRTDATFALEAGRRGLQAV
ncbi:alkaline phosphatase D [Kytococcus aerolatus]|uniref:Alkaline phosphatase D n=1 Tax=Kytococcus aerolatus TaxID=592308 RepID=A0A212TFY1_9MICO|nr:alkaline phosphatase D family protein [Kytococcus aerolatus]SNC64932.1 alkaline phosphatase D [Kytococcus aerolatus]